VTDMHEPWTGGLMKEQCETTEFFEPDKVYAWENSKSSVTGLRPEFWCRTVFTHPDTRQLLAVGLYRHGDWQVWHADVHTLQILDWKRHPWIVKNTPEAAQ
jgi:hypothetical protein